MRPRQVQNTGNLGRGHGHLSHRLGHEHIMHTLDGNSEQLPADNNGDILNGFAGHSRIVNLIDHAATPMSWFVDFLDRRNETGTIEFGHVVVKSLPDARARWRPVNTGRTGATIGVF